MKGSVRIAGIVLALATTWLPSRAQDTAPLSNAPALYAQYCAQCHGANLEGGQASSFLDGIWQYGDKRHFKARNIKFGIVSAGMPAWGGVMNDDQIEAVLAFILDRESVTGIEPPPLPTRVQTVDYALRVEALVPEMSNPWSLEFVDRRRALVTEVEGRLRWLIDGQLADQPVAGMPLVHTRVQGGLLDLAIDPDYAANGWVYIAFTDFDGRDRVMISVARGRIVDNTWTDQEILFRAPPEQYTPMNHNQGARLMFDRAGHLYFSIGDQGNAANAPRLDRAAGKIHRLNRNGTIPADNPFLADPKALPSLYTIGNRNAQGLARHPITGANWETEHGPMGGDEVNLLAPGADYGWPATTFGVDYDGSAISEHSELPGVTAPVMDWTPSIAVCGIDFHPGTNFPAWTNNLFVTSLKFHQLRRLVIADDRVVNEEIILKNIGRVRDVDIGPDGSVYVLTNNPGRILRLSREN